MRRAIGMSLGLGLALAGAWSATAIDYWDASVVNDDTAVDTYNEMYHGVSQQHDLEAHPGPVLDEDWSFLNTAPVSSYEAIIDSMSADLLPTQLFRYAADGTTLLQGSEPANVGAPQSVNLALRWENATPDFTLSYLRVFSGGCGALCTAAAQYRIRFYDTTIAVPRFNNVGGQVTVLIVQNTTSWPANRPIAGTVYFWNAAGTSLGSSTFNLGAKAALVLNTATVPGVGGQGGTVTIAHNGGYGSLAVKSVALEPSTGFSFDSPGTYKPL